MTREVIGDACAYFPAEYGGKPRYAKIGTAFRDGTRISLKIDTLPLAGSGWQGWVNVLATSKFPSPPPLEEAPLSDKAKTGFNGVGPDDVDF